MYGFSLVVSPFQSETEISYKDIVIGDNYRLYNHMIDKFEKDKLFYHDEKYVIGSEDFGGWIAGSLIGF